MLKDSIFIIRDTETGKIWIPEKPGYNKGAKCAWASKNAAVNAWQLHAVSYAERKGSFARQTRYKIEEIK